MTTAPSSCPSSLVESQSQTSLHDTTMTEIDSQSNRHSTTALPPSQAAMVGDHETPRSTADDKHEVTSSGSKSSETSSNAIETTSHEESSNVAESDTKECLSSHQEVSSSAACCSAEKNRLKEEEEVTSKGKSPKAKTRRGSSTTTTPSRRRSDPPDASTLLNNDRKIRRRCRLHRPTLEELQRQSFSDYVRHSVLPAATRPRYEDELVEDKDKNSSSEASTQGDKHEEHEDYTVKPIDLIEGIAKVVLPQGFTRFELDRTGRGPEWQAETQLGDLRIPSPIQQNVRGMAGIYEYTFTDRPATTLAAFRETADAYRKKQVGVASESLDQYTDSRIERLERQFWKRLGPTMQPPLYGADMEGTLFADDPATGWSLAQLDSCLQVLPDIPGVTSPYLYAGMWSSVFCAHAEDMNLLSINYLHAGEPKIWYGIAEPDAPRFLSLAAFHYVDQKGACKEFLRHKRCLLSPVILEKAGIRFSTAIQFPGEAVIAFPGGLHFGFNCGFNIAEATNFGIPEWLPFGRQAKVCLCRPDSVRIDIPKLTALLERYDKEQRHRRRGRKQTWKEWRLQKDEEQRKEEEEEESRIVAVEALSVLCAAPVVGTNDKKKSSGRKKKLSEQQRKNEFWVEVMKPVPANGKVASSPASSKRKGGKAQRQQQKGKNGKKGARATEDVWHLAKPVGRQRLDPNRRVLCIIPAIETGVKKTKTPKLNDDDTDEEEEDDEQCFAGFVVESKDNHVRIRLDGLPKSEDMWMPVKSPKLFLDGGQWDDHEHNGLEPLHYWEVMDSRDRCVSKKPKLC